MAERNDDEHLWLLFTSKCGMLPERREARDGEHAIQVAVMLLTGLSELRDGDVLTVRRAGTQ